MLAIISDVWMFPLQLIFEKKLEISFKEKSFPES